MRVVVLKGHERGLSCLKFNAEGDLLFTSGKDTMINCWYTESGLRLGTYHGHTGAIWDLDVDVETRRLLSGSADATVKLWDCRTGREQHTFRHTLPVRSVAFAHGEAQFLSAEDNVMGKPSSINIFNLAADPADQRTEPVFSFACGRYKIVKALWGPGNQQIFTVGDSAKVHVWNPETGELLHTIEDHSKQVNSIEFSQDGAFFLTASSDYTARLYETRSLSLVRTYATGRPCNGASISPLMDHVIIGGGQAAAEVTGTRVDPAQFATRIYHKIFAEEMGMVMGHFGTVNAIKFSPTGKQFATGGEDGFIRLNYLDDTYFHGLSDEVYLKALADRLER